MACAGPAQSLRNSLLQLGPSSPALDAQPTPPLASVVPICKLCQQDADELVTVTVNGKRKRACEDCAERLHEEQEIAEQSESVVQQMMGFKGRR
jgi:hypothetical protein